MAVGVTFESAKHGDSRGPLESEPSMEVIAPLLRALDSVLDLAVKASHAAWSGGSVSDRFRGLYIGSAEIEHCLKREPGIPDLTTDLSANLPLDACPPLKRLQELFSLTPFDLSVVVIALAPEVDLKYERLYGYLQDDVTRKRPTVDLALNLLSSSADEKLKNRRRFSIDAPLLRQRIVHLTSDTTYVQPPLLAHYLKLDEQILRTLLSEVGLDSRLRACCRLEQPRRTPDGVPLSASIAKALTKIVRQTAPYGATSNLILHFHSTSKAEMQRAARVVAIESGSRLLIADLCHLEDGNSNPEETVELVLREARLVHAIPYLELGENRGVASVCRALCNATGTVIAAFAGEIANLKVEGSRTIRVDFPLLDGKSRRNCWEVKMQAEGVNTDLDTLECLANRFRFAPEQIAEAVEESCASALWRLASQSEETGLLHCNPMPSELYAAARAQSGSGLAAVARKLEPIYTWHDLVLPSDTLAQLHEICQRVSRREHVMTHWGFDRKLSLGKGTSALFAGPSGTGKTMAAEVIANEVELDLFTIDLAGVVSKYIGETEKNLDRIFATAAGTNAILFFDEADALFGKRSEVRDSHDRYANLEISYLLQKMDAYEGVTILASNLRQHMDESFIRRLAFTVLFPFPDETYRQRIWRGIWPAQTPVSEDIDFDDLAKRFKLSGGNIKNVALASAFLAAEDGGVVGTEHLLHAIQREYQKMGKTVHVKDLCQSDFMGMS